MCGTTAILLKPDNWLSLPPAKAQSMVHLRALTCIDPSESGTRDARRCLTQNCASSPQGDDEKVLATVAQLCHEEADPQRAAAAVNGAKGEAEGRTSTKRDRQDVTPAEAKLGMMNLLSLFARGRRPRPDDTRTVRTCRRLFAALVLRQLVNEVRCVLSRAAAR